MSTSCTVWPREYLQVNVQHEYDSANQLTIEPRSDNKQNVKMSPSNKWPKPDVIGCVGGKIRIFNPQTEPLVLFKGQHIGQVHNVTEVQLAELDNNESSTPIGSNWSDSNSYRAITIDSGVLDRPTIDEFLRLHKKMNKVFEPSKSGYNGKSGPVKAIVNMGPVYLQQRRGKIPQYSRQINGTSRKI